MEVGNVGGEGDFCNSVIKKKVKKRNFFLKKAITHKRQLQKIGFNLQEVQFTYRKI